MNGQNNAIGIVAEWVDKADCDLRAVSDLLRVKNPSPDIACFHAQQCVEKYLKAILAFAGIQFPKTHNIEALVQMLPPGVAVSLTLDEQHNLATYATVTRYPGDYEPVTLAEAREAVKMARRVRREIRQVLPKQALRRRRTQ